MHKFCRSLANFVLTVAMLAGVSLVAPTAEATSYRVQIDDQSESPVVQYYADGGLLLTVSFGESYSFTFDIGSNGGTIPFGANVALNIYDADGITLSDTLSITTNIDHPTTALDIAFVSDTEGGPALIPLLDALRITETGDWQTVLFFLSSTSDNYTFQFRSDAETPLPGAIWLFGTVLAGATGVNKWRRKRKAAALAT